MISKKSSASILFVRTIAFIIFCGISVVLNLNMLILLASSTIERIVFILVSIAIEGAKIYYVTTAPIYKQLGKKLRAKVHYLLYAMCAFISISAAFGYVTTTILSTDIIIKMQSSTKEISYMDNDLSLIENQINELVNQKKEAREVYKKDLSILDSQIDILISEISEKSPEIPKPYEEEDVILNANTIKKAESELITWEKKITRKKGELETLKKQKTNLILNNNSYTQEVDTNIVNFRIERDNLVADQNVLEEKEIISLETGNKTDMFTAVGDSFGVSGHLVMTIILLFIAFSVFPV